MYDNVFLKILGCRTDSGLYKIIKKISVKEMKVVFTNIYLFCKLLYK